MRVLVAADRRGIADEVLREGAGLVGADMDALAVLEVLPHGLLWSADVDVSAERARVREQVAHVVGPGASVFVDEGAVVWHVAERAAEWRADVVVVDGRVPKTFPRSPRSLARRLVRSLPESVLVARPGSEKGCVLAATDLSDASSTALRVAEDEAKRRGVRLKIVHALGFNAIEATYVLKLASPSVSEDTTVLDLANRALRESVARLGIDAETEAFLDAPAQVIVRQAKELGAGLVVIGSAARAGLSRAWLGSVARRVVRTAGCSVLVVRRKRPG